MADAAISRIGRVLPRPAGVSIAVLAAVVATAGHFLWMLNTLGGTYATAVVSDVSATVAATLAGIACLRAGRRAGGPHRWGWSLLGLGMLAWAAGEVVWAWYELVRRIEVPFPSVADAGFLAMVPLALAGMVGLITVRRGGVRALLDGVIISGSLYVVSWVTVLEPVYRAGGEASPARVVALAYPIGDIAIASMVFIMMAHSGRRWRVSLALVGAGVLALAVADSGFAYLTQTGVYSSGALIDSAWIAGFLLIAFGAWWVHPNAPDVQSQAPLWVALPYVPFGVAVVAGVAVQATHGRLETFVFLVLLAVVLLVVVRQLVTVRENLDLTRRLKRTVDELSTREGQLRDLAFNDPLTGLANRALFVDRVEHALAVQGGHAPLTVLNVNVDNFRRINEQLGSESGDQLLIQVGARLNACVRHADTVARLTADGFAVLIEQIESQDAATDLGDRIIRALGEPYALGWRVVAMTASVGLAMVDAEESGEVQVGELMRRAEVALYAAKLRGDGGCVAFDPSLSPQGQSTMSP